MKPVEIPGITLHTLTKEWNERATGAFIQSLRSVGDEKFVLKAKSRTQTIEWLIQFPSIIIESGRKWNTIEDQPGFVKRTKDTLDNAKISSITQHEMDRILVITCTEIKIILELFGDGNIILTNDKDKILDVVRAKEWKTRILKKGETYAFPPGPASWDHLSTNSPSGGKSKSIGGMLVTQVGVPAPWTKSLCETIQRQPEDEQPLSEMEWKKTRDTLKKWHSLSVKEIEWTQTKDKNWILPKIKGMETGNEPFAEGKMSEIQNQLEEMLTKEPIVYEEADEKHDKERNALQINRDRQEKQKKEWEDEAKLKQRTGEWIYEHFDMIEKLLDAANQARKKKMSDDETLKKIQGQLKIVKK